MTYTVLNPSSGEPEGRGLSATEAAAIVLNHDGHEYEVRREADDRALGDGTPAWQLYASRGSQNSQSGLGGMTECYVGRKLARAYAATEAEAWPLIARQVVEGCGDWRGSPDVVTDESYDRMLADMVAENY